MNKRMPINFDYQLESSGNLLLYTTAVASGFSINCSCILIVKQSLFYCEKDG